MDSILVRILKMIDIGTAKVSDKVYVIIYTDSGNFKIYGTEILEIIQVPFPAYEYNDTVKPMWYQTQFKLKGLQRTQLCGYMFYTYIEAKEVVLKRYENEYSSKLDESVRLIEDIEQLQPLLAKIRNDELLEQLA